MSEPRLIEIYRAKNTFEAHLMKAALEDAGIRVQVTGDFLNGAIGDIPVGWNTAPQILVMEPDAEQARKVIDEIEAIQRSKEESSELEAENFDESSASMSERKLVQIYVAENTAQAHVIQNALEDAGIPAQVQGDALSGGIPLGWATAPTILVFEEDAERARLLIEEGESHRDDPISE